MNSTQTLLRREVRVALSRHGQPIWFRILKWIVILVTVALWHDRPAYWWTIAALTPLAFAMHLVYRWKTRTWTRAWGGWNDLAAGRD